MLWAEDIPVKKTQDKNGKSITVNVIAGKLGDVTALAPAPDSWAAYPENEVAIWTIKMEPGAEWILPAASDKAERTLYFYRGDSLEIDGREIETYNAVKLNAEKEPLIRNRKSDSFLLLLQGKPVNEPVVQYGPFVMNTQEEIQQAFSDYRRTEFGGWPWERPDNVHPRERGRFAKHKDEKEEVRKNNK
jgi:redox-sensitive bicupin YhaK (pirin superfamily)